MKTKALYIVTITVSLLFCLAHTTSTMATEEQPRVLRLSCSAQIEKAIGPKGFEAFEQATGIKLKIYASSSGAALNRLMLGHSDIAGTTEGLLYHHQDHGYVETPICKDALAVIVNSQLPIQSISVIQIRQIFSGNIRNWKEIGGPDLQPLVVIPSRQTAAYKNFNQRAMRYREIKYDLMAYKSTSIIDVVERFPNAISFISQGSILGEKNIKNLKVNGMKINEKRYPFQQIFAVVTKGAPKGDVKAFVDFWQSSTGMAFLKGKDMSPIRKGYKL